MIFVLRNPSLVQFVVVEISPDCRRVARFRVEGHRGVNRVRLGPRVGRHSLRPGTYRLVARAVPGGRQVVDTRLVVVRRANRAQIEAARGADTCVSASGGATDGAAGLTGSRSTSGPTGSKTASASGSKEKPARHQGVLGAKFTRKAVEAASHVPLWLFALVGLAIVLLAAGAFLPKVGPAGLAASLVFGLTGAMVLLVAMVAYIIF